MFDVVFVSRQHIDAQHKAQVADPVGVVAASTDGLVWPDGPQPNTQGDRLRKHPSQIHLELLPRRRHQCRPDVELQRLTDPTGRCDGPRSESWRAPLFGEGTDRRDRDFNHRVGAGGEATVLAAHRGSTFLTNSSHPDPFASLRAMIPNPAQPNLQSTSNPLGSPPCPRSSI